MSIIIFGSSGFALPYTANVFILMILHDFCLLPVQFCCIIVYVRKVESCVQWLSNQRYFTTGGLTPTCSSWRQAP
jgi:hypothetical protein